MQFHYVTNGRSTVDETQLGLYFHDSPPQYEKLTQVVSAQFTSLFMDSYGARAVYLRAPNVAHHAPLNPC